MPATSAIRSLTSAEKARYAEVRAGLRNGSLFAVTYGFDRREQETWSDSSTLMSSRCGCLREHQISSALRSMIRENVEMCVTVTDGPKFAPVSRIEYDDVVRVIEFQTYKDEAIACHDGIPPYVARHILNKSKFEAGKPLWEVYIADGSMVIFHCHNVLFDLFAAGNFHVRFQQALQRCEKNEPHNETLFVYEGGPLQLPIDPDACSLPGVDVPYPASSPFVSFVKNVCRYALKPFGALASAVTPSLRLNRSSLGRKPFLLTLDKESLYGTTVSGYLNSKKLDSLLKLISKEEVCVRSFLCAITLLSLKPLIRNFDGSIAFSIPLDLRTESHKTTPFGFQSKRILVDCPLALIDDRVFESLFNRPSKQRKTKLDKNSPKFSEGLLEYQFKRVTTHVMKSLTAQTSGDWTGKRKYSKCQLRKKKIIEINVVDMGTSPSARFQIKNMNFTDSLGSETFMSLSCALMRGVGMNMCMHYLERDSMDMFVDCFQTFLDELS
ncbi:ACR018Cp [Eremothecium gossypii ATCC 10895]|uniref:ACR018Cp n=1 Tax=Eremothecium gossypii (strain ATCC 10895 / CBS 109.51 / FGSC 9923 / NRRL Y-1056) TaxID=284811 RepID=Q75C98_EREGS|nr:ACR018Cp [Eremothecium gossypii ATCC 10895]AAS51245.2 ACR018Cp [Eremothecium gossypii ATCC 10895]